MGDTMYKIGDLVTRKSYDHDIIFRIVDIIEDNYFLKGVSIRLYADSYVEDLKLVSGEIKNDFNPELTEYRTLDRDEYFYLPGKVLHIDGDNDYLKKWMDFYDKNKIKAYGIYLNEEDFASNILSLLLINLNSILIYIRILVILCKKMGLCMWKMQSPVINIQKSKNYPYVYMTLQAKYFTFFCKKI